MKGNMRTSVMLNLILLGLLLGVCSKGLKSQTLTDQEFKKIWYVIERNAELDSLLTLSSDKLVLCDLRADSLKKQVYHYSNIKQMQHTIIENLQEEIKIHQKATKKEAIKKRIFQGSSGILLIAGLILLL